MCFDHLHVVIPFVLIHMSLSLLAVCDPPCENGVCLPNNTCNCAAGFSVEDRCTEPGIIYVLK